MLPGKLCVNENIFRSLIKDAKWGYFFLTVHCQDCVCRVLIKRSNTIHCQEYNEWNRIDHGEVQILWISHRCENSFDTNSQVQMQQVAHWSVKVSASFIYAMSIYWICNCILLGMRIQQWTKQTNFLLSGNIYSAGNEGH